MCHLYRCSRLTAEEEVAQVERLRGRGTARVEGGNLVEGELEIATMEREQVVVSPVINELLRELEVADYQRAIEIQARLIWWIEQRVRQIDANRAQIQRLEREMETNMEQINMRRAEIDRLEREMETSIEQRNRRRQNFTMFMLGFHALFITFVVFSVLLLPLLSCQGYL